MSILVTGGAGYIASHTIIELLKAGYDVVSVDNFYNSSPKVNDRIRQITGKDFKFYHGDILDSSLLDRIFSQNQIQAVIHFAAYKAVGESVEQPLKYYRNNIGGSVNLLEAMDKVGVKNIIYSSSATVYGDSHQPPFGEDLETSMATNPYGYTKLVNEQLLQDMYTSDSDWSVTLLRYFNPIGAHESGLIGEDPQGIPNNLMPYITQVAVGKLDKLNVYGDDYDTPDGTGVRDYIHVVDLARGHVASLEPNLDNKGIDIYNLGTGKGVSVLELVSAFQEATGIKIPYQVVGRRPGDVGVSYADPKKAEQVLDWKAQYDVVDMCRDSWRWQRQNPQGYND